MAKTVGVVGIHVILIVVELIAVHILTVVVMMMAVETLSVEIRVVVAVDVCVVGIAMERSQRIMVISPWLRYQCSHIRLRVGTESMCMLGTIVWCARRRGDG